MNMTTAIEELLGLQHRPVAAKFQQSAPEGVATIDESAVPGCTHGKFVDEGRTFYTEASDHFGCPIGAPTHGINLPDVMANNELEAFHLGRVTN